VPGTLPGGGDFSMGLAEGAMDDDQDLGARFRLPESFAEAGDPVEGNPYPTEHPAHQVWIGATRKAEMEVIRINSDASSMLTPATAGEWMPTLVVGKFDAWAGRGVQVVWTDDDLHQYDAWLVGYANGWIDAVSRLMTSDPPPFPPERVLADLRRRLGARVLHWKAEARRYHVEHEDHAGVSAPEAHPRVSREVVERRRRAVRAYCDGHELDAVGFARNVGISETAVRGIIREDRKRFDHGTQEKLLAVIGMTREEWYRE
jgi:hypothetical protein